MRNILFVAAAVSALFVGGVAMADEFAGQNQVPASQYSPQVDLNQQQAVSSQFADPTAPGSIRSHGHP